MLRTSLHKMVHFILIGMQNGNKTIDIIYLRVFITHIEHFYVEINKTNFYSLLVDSWGNSIIDFATGSLKPFSDKLNPTAFIPVKLDVSGNIKVRQTLY